MAKNVAAFTIERMREWGIKRIFGYPGDGINGLMGALRQAEDEMEFIQTRHEEMAAFMACAHICRATARKPCWHSSVYKKKESRRWQEKLEEDIERWWSVVEAGAQNSARPLNPQYVFSELSKRLPTTVFFRSIRVPRQPGLPAISGSGRG